MKRLVSGIMLTLLLISMLTLAFNIQPVKTEPTTITVPDNYPTIQEAINAANLGDTVFVKEGDYYGNVISVNKTISLVGESANTVIIHTALFVSASNVMITEFTIEGGEIIVFGKGVVIHDNVLQNGHYGITVRAGKLNNCFAFS